MKNEQERLVKALAALEVAEARAEKAEAESADMACAAYLCGKYAGHKELEAEVVRLTKERDWLAEKLSDVCFKLYPEDEEGHWWFGDKWKEAARKAVEGKQ